MNKIIISVIDNNMNNYKNKKSYIKNNIQNNNRKSFKEYLDSFLSKKEDDINSYNESSINLNTLQQMSIIRRNCLNLNL